jgi:hypothetical protein
MCEPTGPLAQAIDKLPLEDKDALREFASQRWKRATDEEPRKFWYMLTLICMNEQEKKNFIDHWKEAGRTS